MSVVALTDEHNMFGAVDLQLKAQKMDVKPIFGLEVCIQKTYSSSPQKTMGA